MQIVQNMQRLVPEGPNAALNAPASLLSNFKMHARAERSPEAWRASALIGADVLAFGAASLIGFCVSGWRGGLPVHAPVETLPLGSSFIPAVAAAGCALLAMIAFLATREHYTYRVAFWSRVRDLALAALVAFAAGATLAFLLAVPLSRVSLIVAALALPPAALALRWVARAVLDAAGLWRLPVVVVGDGVWAERAAAILQSEHEFGFTVAACLPRPHAGAMIGKGLWQRVLNSHGARLLVLAYGAETHLDPALIASLVRERVPYALLPEGEGLPTVGATRISLAQDAVMVCYRNNLKKPAARALKMSFDVVAASAALVVLLPVMLVIAALVGMDGGPVLFAHGRIGAKGQTFGCLKFRSMVVDSDAALKALFARNPASREEWLRTHKLRNDPRVTWIGRFLRKTSLDELPQLLNVLRLEMSLVGPRPIVSQEVPKYGEDITYYYETRPGITGLWQVSGRSDTTYAHRVYLDSWYVKNWTLLRDLAILFRTIPAVLTARGAG